LCNIVTEFGIAVTVVGLIKCVYMKRMVR
jgi:hypothetical protein